MCGQQINMANTAKGVSCHNDNMTLFQGSIGWDSDKHTSSVCQPHTLNICMLYIDIYDTRCVCLDISC